MAAKVKSYEDYQYDNLCLYAGFDCLVTSDLARALWQRVSATPEYVEAIGGKPVPKKIPSVIWEMENVKMVAHEFIVDLENFGFQYDVKKNREFKAQMEKELEELERSIYTSIGRTPETFNLDSGVELSRLLFEETGLEPVGLTAKGAPSTDGQSLRAMAKRDKLPWLEALAKRNDISSIYNSFIKTYVEDYVKRDGRIHPKYNLHGTSSHRISSDNPRLGL